MDKESKLSITRRRLVCGVGINDADYNTSSTVDGKKVQCIAYRKWQAMLSRCYSDGYHSLNPSYVGCNVCDEWLIFSNFKRWFDLNYVDGWDLDKDIKIIGNKTYSPDACIFVPACVNSLILGMTGFKNGLPSGVEFYKDKPFNNYRVRPRIDGKKKHIGYFDTIEEAHSAYIKVKNDEILRKCNQYPSVAKYLSNHMM